MGIQKQEFYEGAALHQLVRSGDGIRISHVAPFFIVDGSLRVHLKYSTGVRSPWGFSFVGEEQVLLQRSAIDMPLVLGLICGSDGIAALPFERFRQLAQPRKSSVWISCARLHREHFEVSGPDGTLAGKIAPSDWGRLVKQRDRTTE